MSTKVSIDTIINIDRPTPKEINRKIKQAKKAVSDDQFSILNPVIIAADSLALGIHLQDISYILIDLLEEITPNEYAGQYPPQRSYGHEIEGYELLVFRWVIKKALSGPTAFAIHLRYPGLTTLCQMKD